MGLSFQGPALFQPWRGTAGDLVDAAAGHPALWWLRGSRMRTRRGLMDEWAAAAQFPPHFGGTWDALRDALADLPEGGTFLVLEAEQLLQEAPPGDFTTLVAVLGAVQEDLAPKAFRMVLQAEEADFDTLVSGLRAMGIG
ncbi:MAG: barstar family protein [Geothrix sp.]|uniref:barstar family protein n=1 Tax=Geothrix sp. TaxID=1962974 RepID=UPI00180594D4|nr:barstar family protein [Geothrix sp.]NWJ41223.1 barstar family protein [Geothrix sp.]WIL20786.1 MAG: barstar family protein [Geothrix sp.]